MGYFGNSSNFLLCTSLKGTQQQQQQVVWLLFLEASCSSRALPGGCQAAIPICSRATPAPPAREDQDAIQGTINSGIHRKGSTLTAESRLLCRSRAFVNSSIRPQLHQCILHTSLPGPICTEQSFLFQDRKHTVALKPIICLLQGLCQYFCLPQSSVC